MSEDRGVIKEVGEGIRSPGNGKLEGTNVGEDMPASPGLRSRPTALLGGPKAEPHCHQEALSGAQRVELEELGCLFPSLLVLGPVSSGVPAPGRLAPSSSSLHQLSPARGVQEASPIPLSLQPKSGSRFLPLPNLGSPCPSHFGFSAFPQPASPGPCVKFSA